jgi:hypothetical protein
MGQFSKWGTLVLLCRDALRIMPPGWNEHGITIKDEVLEFRATNGTESFLIQFPESQLLRTPGELKETVAGAFVERARALGYRRL